MGWEFEHLYRFNIGGVEYADLDMMNDEDVEDACDTMLSEVLPVAEPPTSVPIRVRLRGSTGFIN